MKISTGLILALACLTMSVAAQFDNEVAPRDTRAVPIKLCGNHLFMALDAVCDMERHRNRGKRHAVPEPSYRMSPFMMSIYRPSIDDEDKWAADWADLKLESNPGRDIYNRISSLRNVRKRSIYGVSDACCKNACTMEELARFCD